MAELLLFYSIAGIARFSLSELAKVFDFIREKDSNHLLFFVSMRILLIDLHIPILVLKRKFASKSSSFKVEREAPVRDTVERSQFLPGVCPMMRRSVALWLCFFSLALADDQKPAADKAKPAGKSLFDGKSLDGWKSSDFFMAGKVGVKDGMIVIEKGHRMTGITYSKDDFPKMNYEVTLEGKRIDGKDFFATTTFPVKDSFVSLVMGGWGGSTVGLSNINGADASENNTNQSMEFKNNQWYKLRIRVTEQRIQAWIDNEDVVDLNTKNLKLSIRIDCEVSKPFGISAYKTVAGIKNVTVRNLTDAEIAEAKNPPKAKD